jgi:hypothetical protein
MEALMSIHTTAILVAATLGLTVGFGSPTAAVADDQLGVVSPQVQSGAQTVDQPIGDTTPDSGQPMVDGTKPARKTVGGTVTNAGRAIGRAARSTGEVITNAWEVTRDHLIDFGDGVVKFLKRPL